jgi:hypothetical protein
MPQTIGFRSFRHHSRLKLPCSTRRDLFNACEIVPPLKKRESNSPFEEPHSKFTDSIRSQFIQFQSARPNCGRRSVTIFRREPIEFSPEFIEIRTVISSKFTIFWLRKLTSDAAIQNCNRLERSFLLTHLRVKVVTTELFTTLSHDFFIVWDQKRALPFLLQRRPSSPATTGESSTWTL